MTDRYFQKRQDKLRYLLAQQGLDGILISRLSNVRYICGFTGSTAACIITPSENYFITDGRYNEQSKNEVKGFKRYIDVGTHIEIAEKNKLIPAGFKIGFENDFISHSTYEQMNSFFPKVNWQPTKMLIENLAAVKDIHEIEALKTAVEITDAVFDKIQKYITIGTSEKEIALEIAIRFRKYGDGEAFPTIVASGPNSALPHAQPSSRELQDGDLVVIDSGAIHAGYHADMTRTVVMGKPAEKQRDIYEVVKQSQQAGIDAITVGVSCKAVDDATRSVIADAGYAENFSHGTGHGIGLEIHTSPRLSQQSEEVLVENNVVTVEPGVYLPGWGGIRIEDDVLVKSDGAVVLNKTPKDLIIL